MDAMTARWRLQYLAETTVGTALREHQRAEDDRVSNLRRARARR